MDAEKLNQALYDKMAAEQDKYRDWLLSQSPEELLNHAAAYVVREDILMEMDALKLPDDQVRALLASPDTMADIYKTYSKMADTGHMDVIRESIEDRANTLIQNGILSPPKQEVVELFGTTALFFNERVRQEDVPEGLYRYDLRGSDDDPGTPASVENHVAVNHAGTILTAKPLDIPKEGFLALDDGLNFTGDEMTVDEFRDKYANPELSEAVYLVDRASLLHLKEVKGGDFEYAVFDKQTKEKVTEGRVVEDDVLDGIDPTHDHLAAARDAAIEASGLYGGPFGGSDVAQVGLTSLKNFPMSDIYRRSVWDPDTLPKDDLRFIDSSYTELFRIPNGGKIEVEYPDRTFSARCEYLDDYHAYIGSEIYHMCQFAEIVERGGGVCRPEPMLDAERGAWKIGWNTYLAVECGAGHWDYKLFDGQFNETKSGELEVVGCSINEVRDMILAENKLGSRSMTPTHYGTLMDKAAARQESIGQNANPVQKPSIRSQLATAKVTQAEKPVAQQRQKDGEAR